MTFYRSLLAVFAALAISMPVFAEEAVDTGATSSETKAQAAQPAEHQAQVDINKASVKELAKIKGITTARAKAIVAYRKKNGDFKSIDDLKKVKGFQKMKDSQLKEIQDQLTLG